MKNVYLPLIMVIFVCASYQAFTYGDNLRAETFQPSVGVMSEDVVRAKFKSYGMQITNLEHQGSIYVVHTMIEGKPAVLKVESLTGSVKYEGKSFRLQPTALATPLVIKPNPQRVPWVQRTIRFEKLGAEGIRLQAIPMIH
jgi:hypothetical protein